jgi:hypothetical protein
LVASALARAEAWLLEPPAPRASTSQPAPPARAVVVVRGLARGCGASTVARGLAAALAGDDPSGAAVVVGGPPGAGPRIATPAAIRAGRSLVDLGCAGVRPTGRVCLVGDAGPLAAILARRAWPVVVDVAHASPPAEGLGGAHLVVLVASPAVEASLVAAVEASLAAAGHRVEVVLNRVESEEGGDERVAAGGAAAYDGAEAGAEAAMAPPHGALSPPLQIGDSRLAAALALGCREARGPFARPIAELADRCRAAAR